MEKENIISTNFIMTNRDLISKFGVNSAVMLGELYGRMNYFRKRNPGPNPVKSKVLDRFHFECRSQKETLPFGKCFLFVFVSARTQHRLRVHSQHHLTVRSTSLSEYGHKTMLPYGKQCCASHKRCGFANDVASATQIHAFA